MILLYVESEEYHVAVLDDVILAFASYLAVLFGSHVRTALEQSLPIDYLRADKSSFEVAVNLACRLRSFRASGNLPRSRFFLSRRKLADKSQQIVTSGYKLVQTALVDAVLSLKHLFVFLVHSREFLF